LLRSGAAQRCGRFRETGRITANGPAVSVIIHFHLIRSIHVGANVTTFRVNQGQSRPLMGRSGRSRVTHAASLAILAGFAGCSKVSELDGTSSLSWDEAKFIQARQMARNTSTNGPMTAGAGRSATSAPTYAVTAPRHGSDERQIEDELELTRRSVRLVDWRVGIRSEIRAGPRRTPAGALRMSTPSPPARSNKVRVPGARRPTGASRA